MNRSYRYYDLIMALFVTVLLTSNIASSAKIIDWGVSLPVLGLPLAFDAGTLLFPISYIFGDVLTEVYGYAASGRRVIWVGFAMAGADGRHPVAGGALPGEATWQQTPGRRPTMPSSAGSARAASSSPASWRLLLPASSPTPSCSPG